MMRHVGRRSSSRMAQYLKKCESLQKKREADQKKISTLISDISHQTKTPLTNISLYTELLLEKDLPKEAEECALQVRGQAEKLQFLLHTLICSSRLENGIITLYPKKQGVRKMVEAAVLQIRPKAQQRGILDRSRCREERPSAGRTPAGRTSVGRPSVGRASGGFRREMDAGGALQSFGQRSEIYGSGRLDRGVLDRIRVVSADRCDGSRNRDPRARDRAYFRKICPRRTGEKSGGRGNRSVPCGPDRDRGGRIFESEKHPR